MKELLKNVCGSLENLGIEYMLSGSLILNIYAIPRMTRDIDLRLHQTMDRRFKTKHLRNFLKMEDTSPEIRKIQHTIFFALPFDERIRQGMEMIISGIEIVENSIRLQYKGISEKDLIIEKIKRLYKNDFSKEEMERIVKHFKERR